MYYNTTYKPSVSLFVKTWVVECLERLKFRAYQYLIDDIIEDFEKRTLIYLSRLNHITELSVQSAQYKLINLRPVLKSYERLDSAVSQIENAAIKKAFSDLKKTLFKYESKLHRIATSDVMIAETPDYIKNQLSVYSKKLIA